MADNSFEFFPPKTPEGKERLRATWQDIAEQLERYRANGIRHLMTLRGDLPSGLAASGELRYASELVAFIRKTTGDWFHIAVACYPEYHPPTRSADDEVKDFKKKADGASIRAFGLDVVTALCAKLLAAGAPGLHFYTLNQAALSTEVWRRLKL